MKAPNYIKQLMANIEELIDNNTIIVEDLTPHFHQWTDHLNRKSTRKLALNDILDQTDLTVMFTTFHPKTQNTHSFQGHMGNSPE